MKKVLIVTSAQPSANPRMKKEAIALNESGYAVTVLFSPLSFWADAIDDELFAEQNNITWIKAGFHATKQPFYYQLALFRQRFYKLVYLLFGNIHGAALKSMVLFSQELKNKALSSKADLYIGHNLGALPSIVSASKKFKAPCLFDFEDFHRGEGDAIHYDKVAAIEEDYVKDLTGAITSSPLIEKAYNQLYPTLQSQTVLNCFSLSTKNDNKKAPPIPLKLFWFSQTIGLNRGLEEVIKALGLLSECSIQLTLLGNVSEDIKQYFIELCIDYAYNPSNIIFSPIVSEDELIAIASNHHIGLATEISSISNRDICLTNKLFTYLIAGNAILYSNTKAQSDFLNDLEVGLLFEQNNIDSIANCLLVYYSHPEILRKHADNASRLANSTYNWKIESHKLLNFIINYDLCIPN